MTEYFVVGGVLLVIFYDIIAYVFRGKSDTISTVIYRLSREYPIIPFAAGVVAGHLFWV